jgi:hypothetical protein
MDEDAKRTVAMYRKSRLGSKSVRNRTTLNRSGRLHLGGHLFFPVRPDNHSNLILVYSKSEHPKLKCPKIGTVDLWLMGIVRLIRPSAW